MSLTFGTKMTQHAAALGFQSEIAILKKSMFYSIVLTLFESSGVAKRQDCYLIIIMKMSFSPKYISTFKRRFI